MTSPTEIKEIFLAALELEGDEREAYLDQACGADGSARARVEKLLGAHVEAEAALVTGSGLPTPSGVADDTRLELSVGDRIGSYVLEGELGAGGFGVVFRALQEEPVRRHVALKVVKLGMDTKSVIARFDLERQALALMDHPNIARVFDAGATEAGRPYFVMELVDGLSITDYCERERLGLSARLALFARAAKAVQHAHQRGVLHRDIKPSNVLVAVIDGEAQPKVIDFGIAKATRDDLSAGSLQTREGFLLGTPTYMSPEQIEGALDIDTRADVYSLGVLLYELVSGMPPFDVEGMGLAGVFQTIRESDPPRPSTRRRRAREAAQGGQEPNGNEAALDGPHLDVPPELDWIVMRCLEKERDRRYATAHDLAADVERFLANEPVEAAPPSATYRLRKLVSRHRAAAVAVVGITLALVAGTVGTSVGLVRAERSNERLDVALGDATEANEKLDAALVEMAATNEELDRSLVEKEEANRRLDESLTATEEANRQLDLSLVETEEANRQLDAALVEARRQASIAQAVSEFLTQDLLGAARPLGQAGRGPETTIEELLDIAALELDRGAANGGRFESQPLVEASLRHTLGVTYDTLGRFAEAARHMERAAELRGSTPGADPAAELFSVSYLGMLRRKEGRFEEALAIQEDAYGLSRDVLGEGHVDLIRSAVRLATAMREVGRGDEGIEILEEVLPISRDEQGEGGAVTTDVMAMLGILYADRERYDEAAELFRLVLDAQTVLLGPSSPVVLNTKMNTATLMVRVGDYEDAEAMYLDVIEMQRRVEGPEHPHTVTTLYNLAELYVLTERLDEAEILAVDTLPIAEAAYGPSHRKTLLWMSLQAQVMERLEIFEDAEALHRDVHERALAAFGPEDPATLDALSGIASARTQLGDTGGETRGLFESVAEAYGRVRGAGDPATLRARRQLAGFLAEVGELEPACELLADVVDVAQRELGEAHSLTLECVAALEEARSRLGDG